MAADTAEDHEGFGTFASDSALTAGGISSRGELVSPEDVLRYLTSDEDIDGLHEEIEKPFSWFDVLDAPRILPEPVDITTEHLTQITHELGLIKLCWPEITDPQFEDRTNFPASYTHNDSKERALLLYAENFRKQFCFKYPNRKPLFLACENECGMQKMVCTTIRPTTLPYPEIETWQDCVSFVADHLKYEPLDLPTLLPRRLYSPHTVFLRQSGQAFELSTALCSLLIGLGYDAYVVSGYAIKDVTMRIMIRVDSPYPPLVEEEKVVVEEVIEEKYKLKAPRDLKSKFMQMMEQRELDKIKAEEEKVAAVERERRLEEEKRPPDDLDGLRVHSWVLLTTGNRRVENPTFIEPTTGLAHPLDTDLYSGVESVWNDLNYWVNMQDCSEGIANLEYDLTNVEKWEHLLVGEPIKWRKQKPKELAEDDEFTEMYDEKHLDVPLSWSMRISIPHDVLKRRFPYGMKETHYKRTHVEEYAPYVSEDGLVTRILRFEDFDCEQLQTVEEVYENRHDKLKRSVTDCKTNLVTETFDSGRDDSVVKHVFTKNNDAINATRTIFYNHRARFDALSKLEITPGEITEYYEDSEDRMYYRKVTYSGTLHMSTVTASGPKPATKKLKNRRPITKILQKFNRNPDIPANNDIATQEFKLTEREIHLKFHYGKGNVTASTRTFIKPSISEMGHGMEFKPELTYGYQAEVGAKPLRQLNLYLMLEEQLIAEENTLNSIRDIENQIEEFLLLRAHEMAFSKLDVPLFNVEQNAEFRQGMLEREEQARVCKEKEVEEEMDYLAPYLARFGRPPRLRYNQALEAKYACLDDFKKLLLDRANVIQRTFEKTSDKLSSRQNWYTLNHESLLPEEEMLYFEEVNNLIFYLHTLEMRLTRHRELSHLRYSELSQYLDSHPMLQVLDR